MSSIESQLAFERGSLHPDFQKRPDEIPLIEVLRIRQRLDLNTPSATILLEQLEKAERKRDFNN